MVYERHSSRHKHLLLHRQQAEAEEEATAVHKQRVANRTDYQAVADVLTRLQTEASKSKRATGAPQEKPMQQQRTTGSAGRQQDTDKHAR